ncbi:MAG TPA: TIGR03564 family F420-dependent LLM class oxidoreductase [Acidimicrobiales bacterium]|nr:TIGR03564 family F420-dependent LLM class oxidoreductase [Acidimicrobiales bacterium]
MRVGIWIESSSLQGVVDQAGRAKEAGFGSVWAGQIFGLDTLSAFAVAGQHVGGLDWGTAVVPTYPRHPAALAMQATTTNAAVGGRLTLGVGPSHQLVIEDVYGLDYSKPGSHTEEYLRVLIPLVQQGKVAVDGAQVSAHMTLSTSDGLGCPVLVSALGPRLLRLAGELADGTVTWMTGPKTIAEHISPTIRGAAARAGRPEPRVVMALPVAVTDDPAAARDKAEQAFAVYGTLPAYRAMLDREGAAGPADVAVVGDAASVRGTIRSFQDHGVTEFVAAPFAERRRTVDALAELL